MSSSPIRFHGSWKMQKRPSEPDRWLEEIGYYRKHIAKDSSCLFRAVSESIFNTQRYYQKVRKDCVKFMAANRHLFEGSLSCPFENYISEMSTYSEFGGFNEILAMSHLYRRDFVIFDANKGPKRKICNNYGNNIFLFHNPENKHFDIVYTKEFIVTSSFCQSIMYGILYGGVYQIKHISYAIEKMLHDKVPGSQFDYFMSSNVDRRKKPKEHTRERLKIFFGSTNDKDKNNNNKRVTSQCKHYTEDQEHQSVLKESLSIVVVNRNLIHLENVCANCIDVYSAKDLLDNDITPFPYKVAKALDPDIYRNIEFDVWNELRKELRFGPRYSDGTTLQVGVKCLCKLESNQSVPYHCHIQEMQPDCGPCLVFIEEIGEKRVVNYEQLQPLPSDQVRPWAPPYRYSRAHSHFFTVTQMYKHIGNVSQKQSVYKRNKSSGKDETMNSEMNMKRSRRMLMWKKNSTEIDENQQYLNGDVHFTTILSDTQSMPLEAEESVVMVDCRQVAGAPPQATHEAQQMPTNGSAQPENQAPVNALAVTSGEMNMTQSSGRTSTPAAVNAMGYGGAYGAAMGGGAYVYGGMKPLMWCAPPHAPPPPGVNTHVYKSVQANGSDLPMNDIPTLRFYYNLGVECMWSTYGAPPPPRFSQGDLVRDMQSLAIQAAPKMTHDKPPPAPKTTQRPVIGPRFKRGPHQHDQKTYANKGPNNRRNSHDGRPNNNYNNQEGGAGMGGGECVLEPPMVTVPYITYPPPVYPMPYYPVEDPCMMGGVGYIPYEEGMEYGAPMPQYYPPPHFVPHAPPPQVPHQQPPQGGEHK